MCRRAWRSCGGPTEGYGTLQTPNTKHNHAWKKINNNFFSETAKALDIWSGPDRTGGRRYRGFHGWPDRPQKIRHISLPPAQCFQGVGTNPDLLGRKWANRPRQPAPARLPFPTLGKHGSTAARGRSGPGQGVGQSQGPSRHCEILFP